MTTAPERKPPGRKPLPEGEGKTKTFVIRTRPEHLAAWDAKAQTAGLSRNAWIEARLNGAKK